MLSNQKIYNIQKLTLKDQKPFGAGVNRLCYIHPDNEKFCIKVVKPDSITRLKAKRSFIKNLRPRHYFDDNLNEYKAYQQTAITQNEPEIYEHIPHCYGWQETDIGIGLVLDYYQQSSGQPCETLETYLKTNGFTPEIKAKLNALAAYLKKTRLMTKNILPHNVVIAPDGKLKIIDGLGALSAFSIANFNTKAKSHYIERRIKRMMLRAQWEGGGRTTPWKDVEKNGL